MWDGRGSDGTMFALATEFSRTWKTSRRFRFNLPPLVPNRSPDISVLCLNLTSTPKGVPVTYLISGLIEVIYLILGLDLRYYSFIALIDNTIIIILC